MTEPGPDMERVVPDEKDAKGWQDGMNAAIATARGQGETWQRDSSANRVLPIVCPVCTHRMEAWLSNVTSFAQRSNSEPAEVWCDCSEGHVEPGDVTKTKLAGCGSGRGLLILIEQANLPTE